MAAAAFVLYAACVCASFARACDLQVFDHLPLSRPQSSHTPLSAPHLTPSPTPLGPTLHIPLSRPHSSRSTAHATLDHQVDVAATSDVAGGAGSYVRVDPNRFDHEDGTYVLLRFSENGTYRWGLMPTSMIDDHSKYPGWVSTIAEDFPRSKRVSGKTCCFFDPSSDGCKGGKM